MITITLFHHTFAFSVTTFPFSFILFSRITYDLSPHITHFLIFKFANLTACVARITPFSYFQIF